MGLDLVNFYPLLNARATDDWMREGTLQLEYFQASITLSSGEGTAEVATNLDEILGLIEIKQLASIADPTDELDLTTDKVITTGAVTVVAKGTDLADTAYTIRGFLVGRKITGSAISITEAS